MKQIRFLVFCDVDSDASLFTDVKRRKTSSASRLYVGARGSTKPKAKRENTRRSPLVLPFREGRRLHGRAYRAQQDGHKEIVGLLLRDLSGRLKLEFVANRAAPGSWTLSPKDIRDVRSSAKETGYRLVGLFHSHPLTNAILGKRDLQSTPLNWLHLVYDVCGREARLWRVIGHSRRRTAVMIPFVIEPRIVEPQGK